MKTDAQIQQDVMAELAWEPAIDAQQIGVQVDRGVVTLTGRVASYAQKYDAERAAQRIAGVAALAVELEVVLASANRRSDAEIAHAAENALKWTTYLPRDAVKVRVEHGWITLTGAVAWEYQRQGASREVRYLLGVKGVSNEIALNAAWSTPGAQNGIDKRVVAR